MTTPGRDGSSRSADLLMVSPHCTSPRLNLESLIDWENIANIEEVEPFEIPQSWEDTPHPNQNSFINNVKMSCSKYKR